MRVLITGAGGMLGQDLVGAASAAGLDCLGLSRSELDITDSAAVGVAVARSQPTVIVNCAAWTDVDGAEAAEAAAFAVNADGAGNLAAAAARVGAWTIHVSSDYVFDGTKRTPYVESDPAAPLSAYGCSKLGGEQAVARAAPRSHTIARSSWLFGEHGRCFPATILRLARERDELTVVDDQIGCPTFTGHLAAALTTLCETRPLGVLHVAGSGSCSWFEFAKEIVAAAGLATVVNPGRTPAQGRSAVRPAYSVLGSERQAHVPELPHWRRGLGAYMAGIRPEAPVRIRS